MKMMTLCLSLLAVLSLSAAPEASLPQIGAQVFIEPGQTAKDVDDWFRILEENGMTVCRIRMFETHMRKPDGTYDFSLYDEAFRAAERHHVNVFATIFPADDTVGGFKYPRSEAHLAEIAAFVKALVTHFKTFPSLYGWVLQNEPGSGGTYPDSDLARRLRKEWLAARPASDYTSHGFRQANFDYEEFQRYYTTWFLGWFAQQVHAIDPSRHLHVNNHAIFSNFPEYDFPAWRTFLTTLGASAHPSWHYTMFRREQFALAMCANNEIIRAGAGPLPFWLTELQGGNNLYSGGKPICPTKEETSQWLWTTLGCGAKGVIFWSLNARATIDEPGEWALITFQREASDRLIAAREVSYALKQNADLFANAQPLRSGVTLLLARESSWTDKKQKLPGLKEEHEARAGGAPMKSTLAWYEALAENGIPADLVEMDAFDWSQESFKGQIAILAHQIAIPSRNWPRLTRFVERGGKLIVEGATGYFDECQVCTLMTGFPLADLLGGTISEFKALGERFEITLNDGASLPAHLWRGTIKNTTGTPLASAGGEVFATRHTSGQGETLWIPSLVGMGAWQRDNARLAQFVRRETLGAIPNLPVLFKKQEKLALLKTLVSGDSLITVMINNDKSSKKIPLLVKKGLTPTLLFADRGGRISAASVTLAPEETLVAQWKAK
jgi:beta-galactosidase